MEMATETIVGRSTVPRASDHATDWGLRSAGVLLFALAAAFLLVTMLAASIAPAYDFHGAAISDLGVLDETAVLFNSLLVLIGILNVAGGCLLYRWHGRGWLFALYVIAGIGAVGAGLFPLSTGGVHAIFALLAFLFFNLEGLATAALAAGPLRVIGLVASAVGLVYAVLMVIGDAGNPAVFGPIGHGGSERMIAYPVMLWLLAYSGHLMGRAGHEEGAASS
jgi:hypothetical membrane protein